jgi:hypothetical protein
MQFLSGLEGMGRYFETPQAYEMGERFDIEGADGTYQAPVDGLGRYFEDAFGEKMGDRFMIQGANKVYTAPTYSGMGGGHPMMGVGGGHPMMGVGGGHPMMGVGDFMATLNSANPFLLIGMGAAIGALGYHLVKR